MIWPVEATTPDSSAASELNTLKVDAGMAARTSHCSFVANTSPDSPSSKKTPPAKPLATLCASLRGLTIGAGFVSSPSLCTTCCSVEQLAISDSMTSSAARLSRLVTRLASRLSSRLSSRLAGHFTPGPSTKGTPRSVSPSSHISNTRYANR